MLSLWIQSFQLLNSIPLQLTVMKERLYNKENAYGDPYQMRNKQYSNANLQKQPISYSPKANPNHTNNSESPYERSPKYEHFEINKTNKYDRNTNAYGRAQIADKYDFVQKKSKHRAYQFQQKSNHDTITEHSFGEGSLQNDSAYPQNKRENAKRKELQIKMSNINCINDKINNLLNMVKKDKIEPSFREIQLSPKRTHSPLPNRINSQSSFQVNQNKSIKSGSKQGYEGDYKGYNKPSQKLRTLSALQQTSNTKRPLMQQYSKQKQYNNEEDKHINSYSKSNYPPSPSPQAQNKKRNQGPTRYKYEMSNDDAGETREVSQQMQRKESKYSPYNQKYHKDNYYQQQTNQPVMKRNYRQPDRAVTPNRNQKPDLELKYSPQKQGYDRSKNSLQNNFMPITLVQQQKADRSPSYPQQQSQQGIKLIDDRLKHIKQKVSQSQTQNKKYQQRLQGRQQSNHIGKIYINEPNHHFQLKVHAVVNDKPQTVKIAQKLAYQIEVDGRVRKARQVFDRIEGEDKWRDLQLKLSKNGVRLTEIQIKELLALSPNQFTPFDREQTNQNADLARGFCEAQKHWQREVNGCATMKSLKSQGFNINQLDLNKKGFLSIQDLVCFVNLYTGHFHKNRDLAIIYRRLQLLQRNKNESGIDFSTFYRAFTI